MPVLRVFAFGASLIIAARLAGISPSGECRPLDPASVASGWHDIHPSLGGPQLCLYTNGRSAVDT